MSAVIVIAAGPSAPESYDFVRNAGAPVVSCSTMLRPLQSAGIIPDIACIIDSSAIMPLHFTGIVNPGILFVAQGVQQSIKDNWRGKTIEVVELPGSSVIHMCVAVASRVEHVDTIHLVGADFCYQDWESHAPGVITRYAVGRKETVEETNIAGEKVLTDRDLLNYKRELEDLITRLSPIRFVNHSRTGLAIRGAIDAGSAAMGDECNGWVSVDVPGGGDSVADGVFGALHRRAN